MHARPLARVREPRCSSLLAVALEPIRSMAQCGMTQAFELVLDWMNDFKPAPHTRIASEFTINRRRYDKTVEEQRMAYIQYKYLKRLFLTHRAGTNYWQIRLALQKANAFFCARVAHRVLEEVRYSFRFHQPLTEDSFHVYTYPVLGETPMNITQPGFDSSSEGSSEGSGDEEDEL